jgi:D-beta-D-heptose 7-phosphate kinase/D-beta-D-heptose 1-phosphate adenosyltransferase
VSEPLDRSPVAIVRQFPNLRALVIGDAILDTWLEGAATRLCREAPVPVVVGQEEYRFPGGAANTAANLAALGASVTLAGLAGDDPAGQQLRAALRDAGVDDSALVTDPRATTLHKRRIVADGQCLVRYDEGDLAACTPASRRALHDAIQRLTPACDLVIVSDYQYGTIGRPLAETIRHEQDERPRLLAIEARDPRTWSGIRATVITPNLQEARVATGMTSAEPAVVARRLREMVDAEHIALTLAGDGVLLVDRGGRVTRLPTWPVPRAGDVGAGDSFTAAMALALATGAPAPQAGGIGIDAASIACTQHRTAVVPHLDLLRRVSLSEQPGAAMLSVKEIAARLEAERHGGRRIVFTNGVFDIVHAGHVHLLNRARELGDVLVVGINSDASVRRLKGDQRPINREQDRLALVSALDAVDYALIFDDDTPAEVIRQLRPDIHVKGGDYTEETLPEIVAVREVGADVRFLPLVGGLSTTNVIRRIVDGAHARAVRSVG